MYQLQLKLTQYNTVRYQNGTLFLRTPPLDKPSKFEV